MSTNLTQEGQSMPTTARAGCFSQLSKAVRPVLLSAAFICTPCLATGEETQGKQFDPLPEELKVALAGAGYPDVEFLVIATGDRIDSFIGEGVGGLEEEDEAIKPGEFSVPLPYGFDFGAKDAGFRAVVISSGSPGSGNDCRRGGTCKSGTGG